MPGVPTRRRVRGFACGVVTVATLALLSGCGGGGNGGSPGSFQSNGPAGAPTNVTGKSNTSGISAGSALQAPATGTPTATK